MNYIEYKEEALKHLVNLVKVKEKSYFNFRNSFVEEPHVPSLRDMTQLDAIKNYCLIDDIKDLPFTIEKLHEFAHHLDSSQIMCYNFFRIFQDDLLAITSFFQSFTNMRISNITKCAFSYEDHKDLFKGLTGETNFDFYAENDIDHIYVNTKYLEGGYSECQSDGKHNAKYELYMPKLLNIVKTKTIDKQFFFKYYPLFKAASRIENENSHLIFVIPRDREDLTKTWFDWHDRYIKDSVDIRIVSWEDMCELGKKLNKDYMYKFEDRYLQFDKKVEMTGQV